MTDHPMPLIEATAHLDHCSFADGVDVCGAAIRAVRDHARVTAAQRDQAEPEGGGRCQHCGEVVDLILASHGGGGASHFPEDTTCGGSRSRRWEHPHSQPAPSAPTAPQGSWDDPDRWGALTGAPDVEPVTRAAGPSEIDLDYQDESAGEGATTDEVDSIVRAVFAAYGRADSAYDWQRAERVARDVVRRAGALAELRRRIAAESNSQRAVDSSLAGEGAAVDRDALARRFYDARANGYPSWTQAQQLADVALAALRDAGATS